MVKYKVSIDGRPAGDVAELTSHASNSGEKRLTLFFIALDKNVGAKSEITKSRPKRTL